MLKELEEEKRREEEEVVKRTELTTEHGQVSILSSTVRPFCLEKAC